MYKQIILRMKRSKLCQRVVKSSTEDNFLNTYFIPTFGIFRNKKQQRIKWNNHCTCMQIKFLFVSAIYTVLRHFVTSK